jgi:hypothetical protein
VRLYLKTKYKGKWDKRENNEGYEPNWGIIYVYMEMSQQSPMYNYQILIKNVFKNGGGHSSSGRALV